MYIDFGLDSLALERSKEKIPVRWDSNEVVNGHMLLVGMSGAGKTFTLKRMVRSILDTAGQSKPRIHIFDIHGDIDVEGASHVRFSEQTDYGLNPLIVNPDPHFGGVRKRIQAFITTINKTSRQLGGKQEAVLRNILTELYASFGFQANNPASWVVEEVGDPDPIVIDGKLYLDVPITEKDEAKALGARWDGTEKCWYIAPDAYHGAITNWPMKTKGRRHPSINDALRHTNRLLRNAFLGTNSEALNKLEEFTRLSNAYQRKVLSTLKRGDRVELDEKSQADLTKAGDKAIDAYKDYVASVKSGKELDDLIRYDSTDVMRSVLERLENLSGIGIFKSKAPPFDPNSPVWRYNLTALSMEERKLFVLFRLVEIFMAGVQRGEQSQILDIIVLDEAHAFIDDDPDNIINTIAKEARKFGIALICASQNPTHFSDDFVSSVGTKVILGIDEMYWKSSSNKLNLGLDALEWIRLQQTMQVQIKRKGQAKNDWNWTVIPRAQAA